MNPEQARTIADHYAAVMEQEFGTTCKVIAAVRDDARNYRPDDKSRTAWQLATHLATGDIWFLDSIINGKFNWDPEGPEKAEKAFGSVADVVAFYKEAYPARLERLKKMTGDEMTRTVDFFGFTQAPAVVFLGMANN